MTTSPVATSQEITDAVAVDYLIEGERTPAAVARGESRLVGMSLGVYGQAPWTMTGDVRASLQAMGSIPRLYDDAVFARTVERAYRLPTVDEFDDLRAMRRLLECAGQSAPGAAPAASPDPAGQAARIVGQYDVLWAELGQAGLTNVYADIELPIVDAVVDMIVNGVPCDMSVLAEIEDEVTAQRDILRCRLIAEFGITKPDDTQQQLGENHPARPYLRDYWSLGSTLTMCAGLTQHYCDRTGCVHGEIDPLGADTGRFSCSSPNLLGVPRAVRSAIRVCPGHSLVEADISQAEFRVLAHFSRDPGLVDVFLADTVDLHARTAALLAVDGSADRGTGKAVNFGIVYGETEHGLSRQLGISAEKAKGYIDDFFRGYPAVCNWIEVIKQGVRRDGCVQTLFGRRRSLPAIWSSNSAAVAEAERRAVNTIIQGSAADLMKIILARLHRSLPDTCRLLMTVHDSVLLEVPIEQVAEVSRLVQETMEEPLPAFSIPIRVDVHIGESWASCKPHDTV